MKRLVILLYIAIAFCVGVQAQTVPTRTTPNTDPTLRPEQIGFAPTAVVRINRAKTDPATWIALPGTAVINTVQGPDSTAGAAKLSTTSNALAFRRVAAESRTFAVGDWILLGVYVKAAALNTPNTPSPLAATLADFEVAKLSIFDASNGFQLDNLPQNFRVVKATVAADTKWVWLTLASKVTRIVGTGVGELRFDLQCDLQHAINFYSPVVEIVPASTMSDVDAFDLQRNLYPHPNGATQGSIALLDKQKLFLPSLADGVNELLLKVGPTGLVATQPPGAGAVNSVFGRTGIVTAQTGDYSFSQISGSVADGQLSANVSLLGSSIDLSGAEATGTLAAGRFPALTGDVTNSAGSLSTTLASVISAGSCTSCNLSYDAKGRITVAANGSGGLAIGGSITSATAGSVLFAGTSGVLAQDNSKFFWDDTNNRLGIGTTSPQSALDLSATGGLRANGLTLYRVSDGAVMPNAIYTDNSGGDYLALGNNGNSNGVHIYNGAGGQVSLSTQNSAAGITVGSGYANNVPPSNGALIQGSVGIGTTSPGEKLEVSGAVKIGAAAGTADGTIQWTGSDFQGRKGGAWVTLTGASGDITDVVAGSGLAGGATSGSATLSLDETYIPTWTGVGGHTFNPTNGSEAGTVAITLDRTAPGSNAKRDSPYIKHLIRGNVAGTPHFLEYRTGVDAQSNDVLSAEYQILTRYDGAGTPLVVFGVDAFGNTRFPGQLTAGSSNTVVTDSTGLVNDTALSTNVTLLGNTTTGSGSTLVKNVGPSIGSGVFTATATFGIKSVGTADVRLTTTVNISSNRTVTINPDASRILTIAGNATISQDYSTAGSPTFAGITLGSPLTLANGGTSVALSDPNANKVLGWDDTDNSLGFWTLGANVTYDHATHTINTTGGGGSATDQGNALINGGFDLFERHRAAGVAYTTQTTFANNNYSADRWVHLTNGGASDIGIAQVAGDTNSKNAAQVKQFNAAAQKFALAQWVEAINTRPLRGRVAHFQVRLKSSSTPDLRIALLEWSGTADTPGASRDVVADWTQSAAGTPTSFFKSTNFTVRAWSAVAAASGSYVDFSVSGTVDAGANNLVVVIWSSSALAQNVTVNIAEAGLYDGSSARTWQPRSFATERALAARYYEVFVDSQVIVARGYQAATGNLLLTLNFGSPKRKTPSWTVLGTWTVSNCPQPSVDVTVGNTQTFQVYSTATTTGDLYFDALGPGVGVSFDSEI